MFEFDFDSYLEMRVRYSDSQPLIAREVDRVLQFQLPLTEHTYTTALEEKKQAFLQAKRHLKTALPSDKWFSMARRFTVDTLLDTTVYPLFQEMEQASCTDNAVYFAQTFDFALAVYAVSSGMAYAETHPDDWTKFPQMPESAESIDELIEGYVRKGRVATTFVKDPTGFEGVKTLITGIIIGIGNDPMEKQLTDVRLINNGLRMSERLYQATFPTV